MPDTLNFDTDQAPNGYLRLMDYKSTAKHHPPVWHGVWRPEKNLFYRNGALGLLLSDPTHQMMPRLIIPLLAVLFCLLGQTKFKTKHWHWKDPSYIGDMLRVERFWTSAIEALCCNYLKVHQNVQTSNLFYLLRLVIWKNSVLSVYTNY